MKTLFETVPDEINTLILTNIPDFEKFLICQNPLFSDLCDWNFWRNRALDRLEISKDYFDIASYRNIPGSYRYLEVLTQFRVTFEALANLNEDGTVSGIYELEDLFKLAVYQNNTDLALKLHSMIDPNFKRLILDTFCIAGRWDLHSIMSLLHQNLGNKYITLRLNLTKKLRIIIGKGFKISQI